MNRESKKRVHKRMLAKDESHLWPINNRFNVTKRAIREARQHPEPADEDDYETLLEHIISVIVNSPSTLPGRYH